MRFLHHTTHNLCICPLTQYAAKQQNLHFIKTLKNNFKGRRYFWETSLLPVFLVVFNRRNKMRNFLFARLTSFLTSQRINYAINDYFHYWLIKWLFLRLINKLFIPWNIMKVLKMLISISQGQMWRRESFFLCPNNSPKHKDSSFIFINDIKKHQILTFKTPNQQFFLLFYLKNDWND